MIIEEEGKVSNKKSELKVKKNRQQKRAKDDTTNFWTIMSKLNALMSLDLNYLWKQTKKLERDFVKCLFDIGFMLLENSKLLKNNSDLKDEIFILLQSIISNPAKESSADIYSQVAQRITSVLYGVEDIGKPLAEFIEVFHKNDPQDRLPSQTISELISSIQNTDTSKENTGIKNISMFLSLLSQNAPDLMFSNLRTIIFLLDSESYQVRISFVTITISCIKDIIVRGVNEHENVEERARFKKTKDNLQAILLRRIFDRTSFVRKEVINGFKQLVLANVIDGDFYTSLIEVAIGRLKDISVNVRKATISLIEEIVIIRSTIYKSGDDSCGFYNIKEIDQQIKILSEMSATCDAEIEKIKNHIKSIKKKFIEENPDITDKELINENVMKDPEFIELKKKIEIVKAKKLEYEDTSILYYTEYK